MPTKTAISDVFKGLLRAAVRTKVRTTASFFIAADVANT